MLLGVADWVIIAVYFVVSLVIGLAVTRKAGSSSSEFFLSGRNMPWWLLGISLVATTFATDTPNLITGLVRTQGVAGNWQWWAFLLTGMLTVFVFARLWRRTGVMTDLEFYELRYSGKPAAFLRGFRAVYLGVFFNVVIMANVTLAAVKIGGVLLGFSPLQTILIAAVITVIYSSLGGLTSVLLTDFFQFAFAMAGSIAAAWYLVGLPQVGGLGALLDRPRIQAVLPVLPDFSRIGWSDLMGIFVVPLAVSWWAVWYPGSEPGGGGFVAQRMLAAKNENHAVGATLLFNALHYALRPWPWILVALASMVVFPTVEDLRTRFPEIQASIMRDDLAYPAMLTFLPSGLIGVVVASLIAAYMSTISTELNWGSSYVVNDLYRRFIRPQASEKSLVLVGRISTVLLMAAACAVTMAIRDAVQGFQILLQIGAGTGLLFVLRWFWWRINAASEIAAMTVSFLVALFFFLGRRYEWLGISEDFPQWAELLIGVGITTAGWITATFLTPPTERQTLIQFHRRVLPGGPGWRKVLAEAGEEDALAMGVDLRAAISCMLRGCLAIWGALFAAGEWIYGRYGIAFVLTLGSALASAFLWRSWRRLSGARKPLKPGIGKLLDMLEDSRRQKK